MLIYCGYPQAHEDDAERTVRPRDGSCLTAVGAQDARGPANARRHRHGLAVVGDLIGSGASQEQAIVGETPNLATRLQGIAEPNRSPENRTSQKQAADLETEAWYRSGIA